MVTNSALRRRMKNPKPIKDKGREPAPKENKTLKPIKDKGREPAKGPDLSGLKHPQHLINKLEQRGAKHPRYKAAQIFANRQEKKAEKAKKQGPTAEQYAQRDPDYRRAIAGYRSNLANLKSQNRANRNDLTTDYTQTRNRLMEAFNKNDEYQKADFASRGLFGSGVYAKARNDRVLGETEQLNDASSSYNRNARQLDTDLSNATSLEQQQESTAKAAAIRRATAQYGLTGRPATVQNRRNRRRR